MSHYIVHYTVYLQKIHIDTNHIIEHKDNQPDRKTVYKLTLWYMFGWCISLITDFTSLMSDRSSIMHESATT